MQICKVKNYQELSRKAANLIAAQIFLALLQVHLLLELMNIW